MPEVAPLFQPLRVGEMELQHRIALAPLTRMRADYKHTPTDLAVEYYSQRSATPGTLLISESTSVSAKGSGWPTAPGIYNDVQVQAWKKIVDSVHAKGCYLYLQIFSAGRAASASDLEKDPDGPFDVVAPSAIKFEGGDLPRAMTIEEIAESTADFATAARNFVEGAGGDGVEIHMGNGYLLDQFLQTTANLRTDDFGGSLEKRARFPLEVVAAVVKVIGESKVGVRMSPYSTYQGMKMPRDDLEETFGYVASQLKTSYPSLAYLHAVEARIAGSQDVQSSDAESLDFLYNLWTPNVFLDAGGFNRETALEVSSQRKNSVIVFGRSFLANPDFVHRLSSNAPLNRPDRSTFYTTTAVGYTDYPFLSQVPVDA